MEANDNQDKQMKIACVQMNSSRDIAANIAKLQAWIKDAAAQGAQLVATPENTFVMGEPAEEEMRQFYTQENHPGVAAAAAMAQENGCWLLIGSVAVADDSGQGAVDKRTYNRSLLFDPQGRVAASYDKVHLFDVVLPNGEIYTESARMLAGEKAVVVQWTVGSGQGTDALSTALGMTICYDLRFPHLYRMLAKAGAQILAIPSAFTVPTGEAHWEVLLRARAIENGCFVIAPAQTGVHPGGRKTYGHAMIIDPWGKILAQAGVEEGIILADIDLAQVEEIRGKLPSLAHDREFVI